MRKSTDKQKRSGDYVRAANGAYYSAYNFSKRKYKFNSFIRFEFVNGKYLTPPGGFPKVDRKGNPLRTSFIKKKRGPYVYPSILVIVGPGGIL